MIITVIRFNLNYQNWTGTRNNKWCFRYSTWSFKRYIQASI